MFRRQAETLHLCLSSPVLVTYRQFQSPRQCPCKPSNQKTSLTFVRLSNEHPFIKDILKKQCSEKKKTQMAASGKEKEVYKESRKKIKGKKERKSHREVCGKKIKTETETSNIGKKCR